MCSMTKHPCLKKISDNPIVMMTGSFLYFVALVAIIQPLFVEKLNGERLMSSFATDISTLNRGNA